MHALKPFFETIGPFGLPMKDKQAKSLETRLKEVPKEDAYAFRRLSLSRGLTELQPGERSDVSWITEETPDRVGDIVVAAGMDDAHFQLNPLVTLNHCYNAAPVGRSLWRRKLREGTLVGVKAKTQYPSRPASWTGEVWPPDHAFALVQAGLLCGKSIGFFPLKVRTPTAAEITQRPELAKVRYIIDQWLLAEYACCFLPMQPHAVVEEVSKSMASGGRQPPDHLAPADRSTSSGGLRLPLAGPPLARTCWSEIEQALLRRLQAADLEKYLEKTFLLTWEKARGRV